MSSFGDIVKEGSVLIDFHATWCGPCKVLSPVIEELARDWNGKVKVIKIDVDKNQELAAKLAVQGVPTMMFFKDGKAVWRKSGALPKHMIEAELTPFMD